MPDFKEIKTLQCVKVKWILVIEKEVGSECDDQGLD